MGKKIPLCGKKIHSATVNNMAAKRHKNHKNKILHLIISIGYESEIREF